MQVAFLPSQLLENAEYFNLPHPRNNKIATFIRKNDIIYELLRVDRPHSSWFIGNSVVSDGVPLFVVPVHPIFLVLPFAASRGKQMMTEDDFFFDTPYMAISNQLKPHLKCICQMMELGDDINYNYDEETALKWLVLKTEKMMPFLKKSNDLPDHLLIEISYDVISHYISKDFANLLKDKLHNKYPGSFPPKELNATDIQKKSEAPPSKKKSAASKLQKPSDNTLISNFFAPVKTKK